MTYVNSVLAADQTRTGRHRHSSKVFADKLVRG